jgi:hypothetical protein
VIAALTHVQGVVEGLGIVPAPDKSLASETRSLAIQHMEEMKVVMAEMPVPATLMACERLKHRIRDDKKFTHEDLSTACADIESRLPDEMSSMEMVGIEADRFRYYSPSGPLFGDDVALRFSSVAYEIEEAANALPSTGAPQTSSIPFALEAGVRAMARALVLPIQ